MSTEKTTKFMLEKQVVLYSIQQDCFHIESVADYLENNLSRILNKKKDFASYHPIGFFDSYEFASEFVKEFRELINKRTNTTHA